MHAEIRNTNRILVCKSHRKRPLGRPNYRCKDNVQKDLMQVDCLGSSSRFLQTW
jgi:hypothetical protein